MIAEPNIPLIEKLMSDERIDLIVATGGPSVVKAAYRSGNPAFGVGPGNAPALVDDTADLMHAAKRIVEFEVLRQFHSLHQRVGAARLLIRGRPAA